MLLEGEESDTNSNLIALFFSFLFLLFQQVRRSVVPAVYRRGAAVRVNALAVGDKVRSDDAEKGGERRWKRKEKKKTLRRRSAAEV